MNSLIEAVIAGRLSEIEELVIEKGENLAVLDRKKNTLLHLAIQNNHTEIAEFLLMAFIKGNHPLTTKNWEGNNIFHEAIIHGNLAMVENLIERGFNINEKDEDLENTPLHLAVKYRRIDILIRLVDCDSSDPTITNKQNKTAFDLLDDQLRSVRDELKPVAQAMKEKLEVYANFPVRCILKNPINLSDEVKKLATEVISVDKRIFVSYCWHRHHATKPMLDDFDDFLQALGVAHYRDVSPEVDYSMTSGTYIEVFMKKARQAHCVVIFLNEAYLKSRNCLFELMQVWESANKRLRPNTYVIRHPEANIFGQDNTHTSYTKHWEGLLEAVNENVRELSAANAPLAEEANFRRQVKDEVRHILNYISSHMFDDYAKVRANGFIDILRQTEQMLPQTKEKERENPLHHSEMKTPREMREKMPEDLAALKMNSTPLDSLLISPPLVQTTASPPITPLKLAILTAIAQAEKEESKNLVDCILAEVGKVEKEESKNLVGCLIAACKVGDIDKVKELEAQGADLTLNDKNGNTPFSTAVYSTYIPLVDYIVEKVQQAAHSWQPNYHAAGELNTRNYGSNIWPYPPSNIGNTRWRDLTEWFENLRDLIFVKEQYKSTWRGSWENDLAGTLCRFPIPKRWTKEGAIGFKNLDADCKKFADQMITRIMSPSSSNCSHLTG